MSIFTLPSSTGSPTTAAANLSAYISDEDDEDTLPYPGELVRNDFLAPNFAPQTYLSTLRNRHQTLEDLRSDLRQRTQLLSKELLDLVNGNYEEFLGLGEDLKGGEEKVEGVRVGLLGFQREIQGVKNGVKERFDEVGELVRERKIVRRDVAFGRSLLEVDETLGELESSMGIRPGADDDDEEDIDDDDDYDNEEQGTTREHQVTRLRQHARQYQLILKMIDHVGKNHPFLLTQIPRLEEVSRTILLDLATALREARNAKATNALLELMALYGDLGAAAEGVKVLKG